MKTLRFLLEKEFRQIFRDPAILRLMFIMPIIQLILLPLAANYEVKNVNLVIVDQDGSTTSLKLMGKLAASPYFKIIAKPVSLAQAMDYVERDQADMILQIPVQFERILMRENRATVFQSVNSVNGAKANIGAGYLQQIIREFNQEFRTQIVPQTLSAKFTGLQTNPRYWYNKTMSYQNFMVPGILAILVTMIGSFLAALNIVKEKEMGTMEQLNVTPIKKYHFILAKLIPFWIIGLIVLGLGMFVSYLFYGILPQGSYFTIFAFAAIYLLAILGFGLLISTMVNTQQQAMLLSFFFMMVFILLGGLYTSIESMPGWAQTITLFNPVKYFIEVMRMVVLKGSGLRDISRQLMTVFGFALLLNIWATYNYKKRS